MNPTAILIADNIGVLDQARELLSELPDELYSKPEPSVHSSGIGSHLRHCVDYYDRFFEGLSGGRIDYDQRERDERLETSRTYAIEKLEALQKKLQSLDTQVGTLLIRQDSEAEGDEVPWAPSSLERELQFQMSHAVHHYALIAVILRLNGEVPPEGFGVAPSTLRYWKETGQCAP